MKIITIIALLIAAVILYVLVISIVKVARDPRNTKNNRIRIATGGQGYITYKIAGKKISARSEKEAWAIHFEQLKKWREN